MGEVSKASHKTAPRPKKTAFLPPQQSILSKKRTEGIIVIHNGENVTPEALNPLTYEGARERKVDVHNIRSTEDLKPETRAFTQSTSQFHTELHRQTLQAETLFPQSYVSASFVDDVVIEPEKKDSRSVSIMGDETESPRAEALIEDTPKKYPTHISLILKETSTTIIFEVPSKTVEKNTDEATLVEEENAIYDYLTIGKGRNRKVVNAGVQTPQILLKSRATDSEKFNRKHNHAFASEWDMYDTYQEQDNEGKEVIHEFIEEETPISEIQDHTTGDTTPMAEKQMRKLMENSNFLEAICVVERILANNNFNEQQKRFRGLSDPSPFREDIEYKYRLDLLWTFANKQTYERCVTALCWNHDNSDILAAAYGKFYYTEKKTGLIMIWNVKNPVQPERQYNFEQAVTALNFSKQNPNLLGIGFYNGSVQIIDISARDLRVVGHSTTDSPCFEPIWQIVWYKASDYFKDMEQVITTSQDGRIGYYRTQDTSELIYSQIMRIARPEGKLKGIETLRRCHIPGIPINRYCAALAIQQHPVDPNIYYVGTSEGSIHKCSRNYYHQHLDLFLAHIGPLYEIKFSPFCNKLFITCGDDWTVRLWVDGISEPLFDFSKDMQSVQGLDWSPTHSTIFANICGTSIYVWDLQRKVYAPQSITNSPDNCRNTVIRFTESGRCLVVGDMDGNVHVYALEDMPFPAFFQDDLLSNAIVRCLVTRPDLIRKLNKLGGLSFNKDGFDKHFSS